MKKKTIGRFLIFSVLLLSLILSACAPTVPAETVTTTGTENGGNVDDPNGNEGENNGGGNQTGGETPVDTALTLQDLISDWQALLNIEEGQKIEFTAEFCLQIPTIDPRLSLPITVENEQLYFRTALYDNMTYTRQLDISYTDDFLLWAEVKGLTATLEQIQAHKSWFVFTMSQPTDESLLPIAVCELNHVYYFLELDPDNNTVERICIADLSNDHQTGGETPGGEVLTLQDLLSDWEELLDIEEGQKIEFTAEFWLQNPSISQLPSLPVAVENGQLYFIDALYDNVTYTHEIDLPYGGGFLMLANVKELIPTLAQIQTQKSWFVFTISPTPHGYPPTIAVCEIDNVYYFIQFDQNNNMIERICVADFSQNAN